MSSPRRRAFRFAVLPVAVLACLAVAAPTLAAGTRRVSVSSAGIEGNGESYHESISAHGRYVAFVSDATNLVANDTNGVADVFVRDRQAGTTRRVSISSAGIQGNGDSDAESISADGRYVAFMSGANNLVANDTNHTVDIFVRGLLP
jgi:Tol biopolymer transport system component